jgi:transcriptional regulator GlxA family with amidase domain
MPLTASASGIDHNPIAASQVNPDRTGREVQRQGIDQLAFLTNLKGITMDKRVERVIALMKADLHQGLDIGYMAQTVNLSPNRFSHLFKEETGVSPIRYLRTLRMASAATLLSSSYMSIKEVMARVGFRDVSHFVRDFKRIYGATPTQYRLRKPAAAEKNFTLLARDHVIGQ